MSTYTQAAPSAYPIPSMATISGGYGGLGTQPAETFANIFVQNELVTSNSTLDDGTGRLSTSNLGSGNNTVAAFYEPGLGNGNFALLAVGKNQTNQQAAQIAFIESSAPSSNIAGFGLNGITPGLEIRGDNRVSTLNNILDDNAGNQQINNSTATASTTIASFTTPNLTNNNTVMLAVGTSASTANAGSVLAYTKNSTIANSSLSLGLVGGTAQISMTGAGSIFLPLLAVTILTIPPANGPQIVAIDPTNGQLARCPSGTANLNGTTPVVISNSAITAVSNIFVTAQTASVDSGPVSVTAKGTGTFSIVSTAIADTNTVSWFAC